MELPAILADLTRLLNAHCGEYPLKEVVVRKGRSTGELMLLLKTRGSNPARTRAVWSELHNLYPGLTGIVISDSSSAAGHGATIVIGQDYYSEVVSGVRFHVPAAAFFQNNPEQTEVLLQQVKTFCEPADREHLLDLYCGVGHFSHYLASYYGLVTGIEENNAVVAAARENAVINDSNNTVFIAGRVEGALARMAKNRPAPETIVLDPPRQGCLPEAIEGIAALSPQKVVYVSCNPATLARDLALLARHHYHVQALQPIDMFPHTHHIECVALIERQDS
jgi:23S rRNA (uracil1939-C5)-methyltransferase